MCHAPVPCRSANRRRRPQNVLHACWDVALTAACNHQIRASTFLLLANKHAASGTATIPPIIMSRRGYPKCRMVRADDGSD